MRYKIQNKTGCVVTNYRQDNVWKAKVENPYLDKYPKCKEPINN